MRQPKPPQYIEQGTRLHEAIEAALREIPAAYCRLSEKYLFAAIAIEGALAGIIIGFTLGVIRG